MRYGSSDSALLIDIDAVWAVLCVLLSLMLSVNSEDQTLAYIIGEKKSYHCLFLTNDESSAWKSFEPSPFIELTWSC